MACYKRQIRLIFLKPTKHCDNLLSSRSSAHKVLSTLGRCSREWEFRSFSISPDQDVSL